MDKVTNLLDKVECGLQGQFGADRVLSALRLALLPFEYGDHMLYGSHDALEKLGAELGGDTGGMSVTVKGVEVYGGFDQLKAVRSLVAENEKLRKERDGCQAHADSAVGAIDEQAARYEAELADLRGQKARATEDQIRQAKYDALLEYGSYLDGGGSSDPHIIAEEKYGEPRQTPEEIGVEMLEKINAAGSIEEAMRYCEAALQAYKEARGDD